MAIHHSYTKHGPVRPWTWRSYRALQIGMWCLLLLGPLLAWNGILNNRRDRPSLQWPKVPGTIFRSEWQYVARHTRGVLVSYSYYVNGQHYVGTRINLWDRFNRPRDGDVAAFVARHPLRSTVEVYYEPLHPEDCVLEPGADEARNASLIWVGSIFFVCLLPLVYRASRFLNKVVAWRKANPPRMPAARKQEKIAALPRAWLSYEPGSKQKLNCFATRDDLDQFIGHDGKALQEWKPEDRILDVNGQEYRLVPSGKKRYDLEPTGETWTVERLLTIAIADAEMLGKDSDALRHRVMDAPVEKRVPVLMKCVDEQAMGRGCSWPVAIVLILFLVLFFLLVFFGFGFAVALIGKWMGLHSQH